MRLLFITQKLHGQDAFIILWLRAFQKRGYDVTVLCLEKSGVSDVMNVISLGKEEGRGMVAQVFRFWKLICTLPYDCVFIHMSPVWGLLGAWWWIPRRTPVYLWYTHYKMQAGLRLLGWYGRRLFCATAQSLPQYEGNPKKVVVGHGIDLAFWPVRENVCTNPHRLIAVHRLSRSKRLELCITSLLHLSPDFTLDIYGIEAEKEYVEELYDLVARLKLQQRVHFHGSVPMSTLLEVYTRHRLILNMASETIDKTMLEAMRCGCYPVTTKANAAAIGIPLAPEDRPESIAAFVREYAQRAPIPPEEMAKIVERRHSLDGLIARMDAFVSSGT